MQPRTCTRHSAGARAAQSQTQRGSVHSAHQDPEAQSAAQRRRRRPAAAGGTHRAGVTQGRRRHMVRGYTGHRHSAGARARVRAGKAQAQTQRGLNTHLT
jgi:hypothetical protein